MHLKSVVRPHVVLDTTCCIPLLSESAPRITRFPTRTLWSPKEGLFMCLSRASSTAKTTLLILTTSILKTLILKTLQTSLLIWHLARGLEHVQVRKCVSCVSTCSMFLISNIQGTRYAFLAVKIFLVKFFSKFRVKASEKTNQGVLEVNL